MYFVSYIRISRRNNVSLYVVLFDFPDIARHYCVCQAPTRAYPQLSPSNSESQYARRTHLRSGNPLLTEYTSRDCARINFLPQYRRGHSGLLRGAARRRGAPSDIRAVADGIFSQFSRTSARTIATVLSHILKLSLAALLWELLFIYPPHNAATAARTCGILLKPPFPFDCE